MSMPVKASDLARAAARVVPDPTNGSSTVAPLGSAGTTASKIADWTDGTIIAGYWNSAGPDDAP